MNADPVQQLSVNVFVEKITQSDHVAAAERERKREREPLETS